MKFKSLLVVLVGMVCLPFVSNGEDLAVTRQKAEQGNAVAQYNLALCYYEGRGVPQDYKEAAKWYRLAAEQGYAIAQTSLGVYGRTVADLYLGARWVNLEMVAEGWAWHYKQYSKDKQLADAEQAARLAKSGLWADKAPVPPWDFRRGGKASTQVQEQAQTQAIEGG